MTTRRKTTVYLDEELLRGAKVMAARTDRKDYEVLEAALRQYLGVDVLERVWARGQRASDRDPAAVPHLAQPQRWTFSIAGPTFYDSSGTRSVAPAAGRPRSPAPAGSWRTATSRSTGSRSASR